MQGERRKEEKIRRANRSTLVPGLRADRRRAGWTQRELSERAGVGHGTVSDLEAGNRGCYPRTIRRLADTLKIEIEELIEE